MARLAIGTTLDVYMQTLFSIRMALAFIDFKTLVNVMLDEDL
jgi:hypothetical protein